MKLSRNFYNNHATKVAQNLIGKQLIYGNYQGIIVETEAYRGIDDEASHAYRGVTNRNAVMFGPPGYLYVYLIYGIYYCLNIVTEKAGKASAVLIRGLILPQVYLNGPGKLCRHLGITKEHNGIDTINNKNIYLTKGVNAKNILTTPRLGIKKATDKAWRFILDKQEIKKILKAKQHKFNGFVETF